MLLSHLYLSVTPRTCSSITLSSIPSNLFTRQLSTCQLAMLLPELVHLLPCLLSQATCSPVYSSTCQLALLLPELVHLLPCLLFQATCSPVYSSTLLTYIVTLSLVNLVTKKNGRASALPLSPNYHRLPTLIFLNLYLKYN